MSLFIHIACFSKDLRHGQWWVHIQWWALPGVEDDGGEQLEGHPAAADSGQDHPALWQGEGGHDKAVQ